MFHIDASQLSEDLQNRFDWLAELEHDQRNMEKLLMGYRQLTEAEKTVSVDKKVGAKGLMKKSI